MIRVQDLHLSDLSVLGVVLTMTFSIASSLLELDDAQVQAHIRQNLILLEDAARARNFALRDDSTLAWNFCTGTLPKFWTSAGVIDEVIGTDLLYKQTNYKNVLEVALRIIANELQHRYCISWKMVWHYVRTFGTEAVKVEVLNRSKLSFGQEREECSEC
tara:strand:+ start:1255 stop:1734 length:480 start_codon:yes stop_codon:yes gene_type:complete